MKKKKKSLFSSIYLYFVELPDRAYPFAAEIEGRLVRGRRSYERALIKAFKKHGPGHYGYKLLIYRGTFHFVGAIIFIITAGLVSKTFFGSDIALFVLLIAAVIALTFQEFYVHPRRYGQCSQKGVTDWFSWVVPMAAYIFLFTL